MISKILVIGLLAFGCSGLPVLAYSATGVLVQAPRPIVEMKGRDVVTIPFIVTNEGKETHTFEETLVMPSGWRLLSDPIPFQLGSGQRDTRLIHLYAPTNQSAGQVSIRYNVESRTDRSVSQSTEVRVSIKQLGEAGLTIQSLPGRVLAGKSFEVRLKLKNTGNITENFVLSADDGGNKFIASVLPHQVWLNPSGEVDVVIRGFVPNNLKRSLNYPLRLKATGRKSGIKLNKYLKMSLVSRTLAGVGKYHSVSSKVTLRSLGSKAQGRTDDSASNVSQVEFSGLGILDNLAEHRLEFDIRLQKDHLSTTSNPFGLEEKYQLKYSNKYFQFDAGDYSEYLSTLLGNNHGRGVAIKYKKKSWEVKSSILKATNKSSSNDTSAISVSYQFDEKLGVGFLYSQEKGSNNYLGLEAKYLSRGTRTNFELATNDGSSAALFDTFGRFGKLSYDLRARHADFGFDGGISDSRSLGLTLSYPVTDRLTATIGSSYRRSNLESDQSRQIKEFDEHYFRVGYNLLGSGQFLLEAYLQNDKDLRDSSLFDEEEKGYKLEYRKQFYDWNVSASHKRGRKHNRISVVTTPNDSDELRLSYIPEGKNFQFGSFVEKSQTDTDENRTNYGLSGEWDISGRTKLRGYWRKGLRDSGKTYDSDFYEVTARHRLNNGFELGLRASQNLSDSNDSGERNKNTSWLAEVSFPLDIPFRKRKNIGSASGRILDAKNNRPIADAVVNMRGILTISDQLGNFKYPNIYAGHYDFDVDLSHLDEKNYAIANGGSTELVVVSGKETKVTIPLIEAAQLHGSVKYRSVKVAGDNPDSSKGKGGLLVILTQLNLLQGTGAKILKRLTSENGQFSFYGIIPGKWQIQIVDPNNVLDRARIDKPVRELVLVVGKESEILFTIVSDTQGLVKSGPISGFTVESN